MSTLTITNTFTSGTTIQSSQMNTNFTDITTWANGNISNNNIVAGAAIAFSKLDATTELLGKRSSGNKCLSAGVSGDTVGRISLTSDGWLSFGPGTASAHDMMLKREDTNTLAVRNLGDSAYKDLKVGALTASGAGVLDSLTLTTTKLAVAQGGTGNGSLTTTAGHVPYLDGTKFTTVAPTEGSFLRWASGGASIEAFAPYFAPGGRLTGTTLVPVNTANVTAIGTIYYTPYLHNRVWLKRTNWELHAFAEVSLALTVTSGSVYDVFLYSNAGTPTLETLVWTNTTTRATAIVLDTDTKFMIKSGDATRLYVGTIYATGSNTIIDTEYSRHIFNAYNRVPRRLYTYDATNSWTYGTTSFRASRNQTGTPAGTINKFDFVIGGMAADSVVPCVFNCGLTGAGYDGRIGIAMNSTTVPAKIGNTLCGSATVEANVNVGSNFIPALGYSYVIGLEYASAASITVYGDNGGTPPWTALEGIIFN